MSRVIRSPVTGNALVFTPRSGSHSVAYAALLAWWPDKLVLLPTVGHGVSLCPEEHWDGSNPNVGMIVRDPVERFRSMIAHKHLNIDEQLIAPIYGRLPNGNFARYFKFERDLDAVCEWLGLPTPLPHEDASDEADKPTLTPEQEARVREIYADDIALWESL